MKIKIFKGENLFDSEGRHILDGQGFAKIADADVECEVEYNNETVITLLTLDRESRGLDFFGNVKETIKEEIKIEEPPLREPIDPFAHLSEEEKKWFFIRQKRHELLVIHVDQHINYVVFGDISGDKLNKLKTYRQQLLDVPQDIQTKIDSGEISSILEIDIETYPWPTLED